MRDDEALERLRPLSPKQLRALWPMIENDDVLAVYSTNAIEGSTLTLSETTVVLQDGVTIGGKPLRDHIDALNGRDAYALMLRMARNYTPIGESTIGSLHEVILRNESHAGDYRDGPVFIRGSRHVRPYHVKVATQMSDAIVAYRLELQTKHPIGAGAALHFAIAHIHPFKDGNGRTARLVGNLHCVLTGYPPILIGPE